MFTPLSRVRLWSVVLLGCLATGSFAAAADETSQDMSLSPDQSLNEADLAAQLPPEKVPFARIQNVPYHPTHVTVRFDPEASLAEREAAHQAAGAVRILKEFHIVPGLTLVEVPEGTVPAAVAAYLLDNSTLYAQPDHEVQACVVPNDPDFDELWGMMNTGQTACGDPGIAGADIKANEAWNSWVGTSDQMIAVIDTGVNYNHDDLEDNIWTNPGETPGNNIDDDGNGYVDDIHGWNCVANNGDPNDDHFHGSHCSGTIGGVGNNGIGVAGVNWDVSIVGVKFLNSGGGGTWADAVEAVQYCVDNNIKLSSNSWGGSGFDQGLYDAIEASQSIGHLFVAAAGNNGSNNDSFPFYPCTYDLPNIISVAAINNNDQKAGFSNYGPATVDLGAPGENVYSTMLGQSYGCLSGTSMACPHVAGTCALVWSRYPAWDWEQVRDWVFLTVRPVDALDGLTVTGGVVNAQDAAGDPDETPPTTPTITSATALNASDIKVMWSQSTDNVGIDHYVLQRTQNPDGTWFLNKSVDGLNYTDKNRQPNKTYYYRVKAVDFVGNESDWSEVVSETTKNRTTFTPSSYTITWGDYVSGTLASMNDNDDNFLVTSADQTSNVYYAQVRVSHNTSFSTIYRLNVQVISKYSTLQQQKASIYNFNTGNWLLFSTLNIGTTEKTVAYTTSNPSPYVSPSGEIRIRVRGENMAADYSQSIERISFTFDHD